MTVSTVFLVKYLYSAVKSFILVVELISSLIVSSNAHIATVLDHLDVNPFDYFLCINILLLLESSQLDTALLCVVTSAG